MNEYELLYSLIRRLSKSDAFSKETIYKLFEDLEEAYMDGRVDTFLNYASEDFMFLNWEMIISND